MKPDDKIQDAKEEARRLGLRLGLALERHNNTIETVTVDGERQLLVSGPPANTIWQRASEAVKAMLSEGDKAQQASPEVTTSSVIIYADGGSRGNPGHSAAGFVLLDGKTKQLLEEGGEYLGITTNNQAEYHALKLALEHSRRYQPEEITAYMDSELVIKQLNGVYRVRNRDLWPVYQSVKQTADSFDRVRFLHVRRDQNRDADRMVNQILDEHAAS